MTGEAGSGEYNIPQHDRITTAEYTKSIAVIETFAQRDISGIRILNQLVEAMGGAEVGKALKAIILTNGHQENKIPYEVIGEKKDGLAPGFRWEYADPIDPAHKTISRPAFRAEYFEPTTGDDPKIRIKLGWTMLPPYYVHDPVEYDDEITLPVEKPLILTQLTEDNSLGIREIGGRQYDFRLDTGAPPGTVEPDHAYGGGYGDGLGSYHVPFYPTIPNCYDNPEVQQGYAKLLQKSLKPIIKAARPPITEMPPI
jgi:hypothetical protein